MILRVLLMMTLMLGSQTCSAQDKAPQAVSQTTPATTPKPTPEQIERWIEELANKSPSRRFRTPADRLTKQETESLVPVRHAYRQLTKHFLLALPLLVEHRSDVRYSYPSEHPSSGVYQRVSVGEACENIIRRKVLLNNPVFVDDREIAVWVEMPVDNAWLERVKGKTLFQMQLDAMDWLLKREPLPRVSEAMWKKRMAEFQILRDEFAKRGVARDEEFGPGID